MQEVLSQSPKKSVIHDVLSIELSENACIGSVFDTRRPQAKADGRVVAHNVFNSFEAYCYADFL
jgi:hypothetical protein